MINRIDKYIYLCANIKLKYKMCDKFPSNFAIVGKIKEDTTKISITINAKNANKINFNEGSSILLIIKKLK